MSTNHTHLPREQSEKIAIGGLDSFDFSLCERNLALIQQVTGDEHEERAGLDLKKQMRLNSSGTTVVGAMFKDGVVMGGDTRSTQGHIVGNKESMKVHYLTDRIYACGAGTAADLSQVADMVSAELKLFELNSGKKARVVMAVRRLRQYLFQYMGYVGCYYLVGGVDFTGPHIFSVTAHGCSLRRAFDSEGSGSYCALAELECGFKPNMTEEECIDLVKKGLEAGMHGDNMSGNAYNLVVVNREGMRRIGPVKPSFAVQPSKLENSYVFKPGTLTVLRKRVLVQVPEVKVAGAEHSKSAETKKHPESAEEPVGQAIPME